MCRGSLSVKRCQDLQWYIVRLLVSVNITHWPYVSWMMVLITSSYRACSVYLFLIKVHQSRPTAYSQTHTLQLWVSQNLYTHVVDVKRMLCVSMYRTSISDASHHFITRNGKLDWMAGRPFGHVVDRFVSKIIFGRNKTSSSVKVNHPDVFNFELVDLKSVIFSPINI